MRGLWEKPYNTHIDEQLSRLKIVHAAAHDLLPEPQSKRDINLSEIFALNARAHQTMMLSRPLIFEDGYLFGHHRTHEYSDTTQVIKDQRRIAEIIGDVDVDNTYRIGFEEYTMNLHRHRSGFNPARYAFMWSECDRQKDHALVVPYIVLPAPFISAIEKSPNGVQYLKALADLAELANHDWLHSSLMETVTSDIARHPRKSPFRQSDNKPKLGAYFLKHMADNFPAIGIRGNVKQYENMFLHFQAKAVQNAAKQNSAQIEHIFENYISALSALTQSFSDAPMDLEEMESFKDARTRDPLGKPKNKTIRMSAEEYGIRLLASRMIRLLPLEHPVTQKFLSHDAIKPYAALIHKIYKSNRCTDVFANHRTDGKPYADAVSVAFTELLDISQTDAKHALEV